MAGKPTYHIDGAAFQDLEGFYDEIEAQLLGGEPWQRDLDALETILRGGVGRVPDEFRLVWEHTDLSRQHLAGSAAGSFEHLVSIIARYPNVELILS